jgi:hypothetical protein
MIGKKMALVWLDKNVVVEALSLPETKEEETEEDGQNADTDGLGLLENLDNAVHERSNPQEPLEECCKHDGADDGDIDNLVELVRLASHLEEDNLRPSPAKGQ